MDYGVRFLKGTADQYAQLASKNVNAFYYVDGTDLYLGNIKLSNAADLQAAITRIAANETHIGDISNLTTTQKASLTAAINEVKAEVSALTGGETGGISDMIAAVTGNLTDLTTDAKENLVAAINELDAALNAEKTNSKVILEEGTSTDYAKVYTVKQGTTTVGTINIPKDMVVQSGRVVTNPEGQTAGTYIELTLANATSDKIYVNVGTLVDIYTAKTDATQVQLAIDSSTREISATIVNGSVDTDALAAEAVTASKIAAGAVEEAKIAANAVVTAKIKDKNVTLAKLEQSVQDSLALADSAVQSIAEGATNGTISVDRKEVSVHGLGSAAYTNSSAYDAAGSAGTAESNAKAYTDAEIQKLDADVSSAAVEAGKGIKVQVVETDGKVTSVAVSGDYSETYDAKGSASDAEAAAKAYTDAALTWGSIVHFQ